MHIIYFLVAFYVVTYLILLMSFYPVATNKPGSVLLAATVAAEVVLRALWNLVSAPAHLFRWAVCR